MLKSNLDFIYQEAHLDKNTCDLLIKHFNDNIDQNMATNVNPNFNNRIIYYEGTNDPQIKTIMKSLHDSIAQKLTNFYHLESNLYPEATHIVKWPEGSSLGNHADNAYENGAPNYVHWRTHSAVIYLNDDYEGGHFYFKKNLPETIKPKTGLLLGLNGGIEHIHGVLTVTQGTRYALPMWFTTDHDYAYPEYK